MDRVRQVQVTCDSYCGANLWYGLPIKDNSLGLFLGGFFLVGGFGFFFFYISFVVCHPQLFVVMMLTTLRRASCGDESINLLRSEVSFVKTIFP